MGSKFVSVLAAGLVFGAGVATAVAQAVPAHISAAVADAARPEADKSRDANRKPADMLVFAEVKPGSIIGEMIPGGGYFTRIFSKAVGPTGHVYAITSAGPRANAVKTIAADAAYGGNITVIEGPLEQFKTPKPVDMVWTSQNYHDLPLANRPAINKAAFDALKPGGLYIVLDHSAPAGTGPTNTLHRMDEAVAKAEVLAAGFQFVGESNALRNPADDRTKAVFDGDVRARTDQFILKFRKP